jgi:hypothetical protein
MHMELSVINDIYVWSYRLAIIALWFLTWKQFNKNKDRSWLLILIGLSIIAISGIIEYSSTIYFLATKNINYYLTVSTPTKLAAAFGHIICVYGCYKLIHLTKRSMGSA